MDKSNISHRQETCESFQYRRICKKKKHLMFVYANPLMPSRITKVWSDSPATQLQTFSPLLVVQSCSQPPPDAPHISGSRYSKQTIVDHGLVLNQENKNTLQTDVYARVNTICMKTAQDRQSKQQKPRMIILLLYCELVKRASNLEVWLRV